MIVAFAATSGNAGEKPRAAEAAARRERAREQGRCGGKTALSIAWLWAVVEEVGFEPT